MAETEITASPAVVPLTSPALEIDAPPLALHVTACPASTRPLAVFTVSLIWSVVPMSSVSRVATSTTVAAIESLTVSETLPCTAPLVAKIVAVPMCRASTTPADDTLATLVSEVSQLMGEVSGLPLASLGVATAVRCVPTSRLALAGVTSMVATVAGGVVPPLSPDPEQPRTSSAAIARARSDEWCGMSSSPRECCDTRQLRKRRCLRAASHDAERNVSPHEAHDTK